MGWIPACAGMTTGDGLCWLSLTPAEDYAANRTNLPLGLPSTSSSRITVWPRTTTATGHPAIREERVALVDLLDRVLAGGVVIVGDVTLSIADVDLVTVSLRALVTSVSALVEGMDDSREDADDR